MDSLIQKQNFLKARNDDDHNDIYDFEEKIDEWLENNEGKVTKAMVLNSLKHIQNQVCRDDFPNEDSAPGEMVKSCINYVFDALENLIEEKKAKMGDFHEPFYEFMMKLIASGPGSIHKECVDRIFNCDAVEFQAEYFQKLKGDKVTAVIKALKRKYYTKEKDIEEEDYADVVDRLISNILDYLFSDEQYPEYKGEFLALYEYFLNNKDNTDSFLQKALTEKADDIARKFGGNIYEAVSDAAKFNEAIKDITKLASDPKFPVDEDDKDKVYRPLSNLYDVIKKNGMFESTYDAIFDFLMVLFQKKKNEHVKKMVDNTGYFFYHIENETEAIVKNEKLFTGCTKRLIQLVTSAKDDYYLRVKLADGLISQVLVVAMGNSKEHAALAVELIAVLIKHPTYSCIDGAYDLLRDKEKAYKWKEHLKTAQEMFKTISELKLPDDEKVVGKYVDFTETFLEQLRKNKALTELNDGMVYFSLGCLELRNETMFKMGSEVSERCTFDVKKNKQLIMYTLKKLSVYFNDTDFPWDNSESSYTAQYLISNTLEALANQGKQLDSDDRTVLINLMLSVVDKDFNHYVTGEPGSVFYIVFAQLGYKLVDMLAAGKEIERMQEVIPHYFKLMESDEDDIVGQAKSAIYYIGSSSGKPLAAVMDELIVKLLALEGYELMSALTAAYEFNQEPVEKHFQAMFSTFSDTGDSSVKTYYYMFLEKVAKRQSELFTDANIKTMITVCADSKDAEVQILNVLMEIGKRKPEKLTGHTGTILALFGTVQNYSYYSLCSVLKYVGMSSEAAGNQIMPVLVKKLEEPEDDTVTYGLLDAMKHIGSKNKPVIEKYKGALEKFAKKTPNQTAKDMIQVIIDWLEGRSVEKFMEGIEQIQDDVRKIDTRVTTNEKDIKTVKKDVTKTKQEVKIVKKDVNKQGQKLDKMGKVVDETVQKVEEIDQKTLSHAPYWSKDISRLLNPKTEHDYRLLCGRLGYSNDDIRAWSQQSDPCMAMLNEWYTTHKTSEANAAILDALIEMDRMDAAVIVENAMKSAEQVVEDEDFDYPNPPPIFLSYQWGHQEEVKLLHRHLEMAGFDCWMDIGQMGGGDKLFEKIDRGIRAAKIIISCTTEKYSKSPNCNREVNLSVTLKKPIIPLLLENMAWPPEGSMGPIFSEYLYIQFFQSNPSDQTKDDRFWPPPKFQELLMQLSMNGIVPDETKVNKMYKNWWTPLVEEIKIDKSKTANGGKNNKTVSKTESNKKDDKSPEVFISYQWDKQKNVMLLYKRLTEMGYYCWMDIHQMGGGDSLYDKIDRGIRGCKVVLSCLTDKYTISANCRREVSLCDALRRPIIPLLMESIQWPPRGPMSMAFTELLYIDMHSDPQVQEKWSGPKFDEMHSKIRAILPDDVVDNSSSAANKDNSTVKPTESKPPPSKPEQESKPPPKQPPSKPEQESKPKTPSNQPQKATKPTPESKNTDPTPNESSTAEPNNSQVSKGSYVKKATPGSKVKRYEEPNKPTSDQKREITPPQPTKNPPPPQKFAASPAPAKSKSCQIL